MTMRKSKALFLDRDGVINVEHSYVYSRQHFQFREGIFELCRAAQSLGYLLLVVTNQAGIARGYYTEAEFLELTKWMIHKFDEQQIQIARVYYCPYHPVHGRGRYKYDSLDRKPKPGMLLRARTDFNLDLSSSILIGDQLSDIDAAHAAGVGTKILLRFGAAEGEIQEDHFHISDSLDKIRTRFFSSVLRGAHHVSGRDLKIIRLI
jgi:D-glycero-D-manno-heptose 1,7-bisphosphate phosphatase